MWNPKYAEDLEKLIDEEVEIDYEELTANVTQEELDSVFPMYKDLPFTLETDWSVKYFRSTLFGHTCYMVRHSAIEYVFI
jgi:hypothetical protein